MVGLSHLSHLLAIIHPPTEPLPAIHPHIYIHHKGIRHPPLWGGAASVPLWTRGDPGVGPTVRRWRKFGK